jgi:hypothetical protein
MGEAERAAGSAMSRMLLIGCGAVVVLLLGSTSALAAVRYAEPGPGGANPNCPQGNPCDIEEAVELASSNDEVVVLPGDYFAGANQIDMNAAGLNVHGIVGEPRPRIFSSANSAIRSFDGSRLAHVEISHTGSIYGMYVQDAGTVEDVIVRSTAPGDFGGACGMLAATLRDSVCWSTAAVGGRGVNMDLFGPSTQTARLRNVTAVATGPGSIGVSVNGTGGGSDPVVDALAVIADGTAFDVSARADADPGTTATMILDHSNYADVELSGTGTSVTPAGTASNQATPPQFVDAAAGNFHQAPGSPTIDSGAADALSGPLDIDGEARLQGPAPDIGADETANPPGGKASRALTFDANKANVRKGKKVRFSGHVDSPGNEAACESSQTVELQRKKSKATEFKTFAQVQTDTQGEFSLKKKVKRTRHYQAVTQETATCGSAASATEKVKVKKKRKKEAQK